jgi:hypothetical protein
LLRGSKGGDEKRCGEQGSEGGERRPSNHDSDRIALQGGCFAADCVSLFFADIRSGGMIPS